MVHQSLVLLQKQCIEGFVVIHSSRMRSIMTGKAQQQELEVTGYTASTVRKQREAETGTQLTFSISFSPGPWHM